MAAATQSSVCYVVGLLQAATEYFPSLTSIEGERMATHLSLGVGLNATH